MIISERNKSVPKTRKILAVASDLDIIRILGVNLTHADFEFVSVSNGADLVEIILAESPDVIILNPPFPDIDMNTVYLRLQKCSHTSHIPVIVVTARKSERIILNQIANGLLLFITKPFDPGELVSLVQKCLR